MAALVDVDTLPPAERNKHYQTKCESSSVALKQTTSDISESVAVVLKPHHVAYLKSSIDRIVQTALSASDAGQSSNFVMLHGIIECALGLCQETLHMIRNITFQTKSMKAGSDDQDEAMCLFKKRLAIFESSLNQLEEFIHGAKNVPLDDLWSLGESSAGWQTMRKFTRYCEFDRVEKSILDYKKKGEVIYLLLAAMGRGAHQIPETNKEADQFLDASWVDNPQFPLVIQKSKPVEIQKLDDLDSKLVPRMVYYLMNKEKCRVDGNFFVANPEPQIIHMLFNFVDKKSLRLLSSFQAEIQNTDAETDIKVYLNPNLFESFLKRPAFNEPLGPYKLEAAGGKVQLSKTQLLHSGLLNTCEQQTLKVRLLYHRQLKHLKASLKKTIKTLPNSLNGYQGPASLSQPAGAYRDPQGFPFPKPATNKVQFSVDFQPLTERFLTDEEKKEFERVFIHVHGGGFVAQTSSSHKIYLNPWANTYKRPIFSIDYRLADKVLHFPEPLNDVIAGYIWILNYLEFVLQVVPKQIILLGDSAGGGLITGLTAWSIANGIRRPDAVITFYPAINPSPSQYTPSMLHSMDDMFLKFPSLKMCGLYYVSKAENPNENPYLNLNKQPAEVVAQFPPTEIFIGDRDPLRDDTFRFALKLFNAPAKVRLTVLKGQSHALLGNAGKGGIDGANSFMEEVHKSLKQVLSVPLQ